MRGQKISRSSAASRLVALVLWLACALSAANAPAQVGTPPVPIPVPPIPAPPRLGVAPKVEFGKGIPPARPAIAIPDVADLPPTIIPPQAPMTVADKNDTVPPPKSGMLSGPTSMVSPGAGASQIQESVYIIDPGTSQIPPTAEAKLRGIAQTLAQNPAARLEVRTFSPSILHSESNAHRLSLSRFLAIREFLIKNGVDIGRIDGRPLISAPAELNADRIELYIER